ncbi:MAG: hypothetical protein NTW47_19250, partial [Proteobacteria bacterium]|nr:hypothetical protein [Pseudomonadota bacterium]
RRAQQRAHPLQGRGPEIRQALDDGGAESVGNTPAEFTAILIEDFDKYAKLVKISGAKADQNAKDSA